MVGCFLTIFFLKWKLLPIRPYSVAPEKRWWWACLIGCTIRWFFHYLVETAWGSLNYSRLSGTLVDAIGNWVSMSKWLVSNSLLTTTQSTLCGWVVSKIPKKFERACEILGPIIFPCFLLLETSSKFGSLCNNEQTDVKMQEWVRLTFLSKSLLPPNSSPPLPYNCV